jgi:uncharacterized protein YdbL (DUF1318 family)
MSSRGGIEKKGGRVSDWHPFYPDETVWLFNECGVFSMAQGQCHDALHAFRAALREARGIEGPRGPIRRRICIKLGALAIERGRPYQARRWLEDVHVQANEDETVRMIAQGYLANLDHNDGSLDAALTSYNEAVDTLLRLGRSRPVRLFLRRRGDLRRHIRDYPGAKSDFVAAINYVRRAGYEDMARLAEVSLARLQVIEGRTRNRSRECWTRPSVMGTRWSSRC